MLRRARRGHREGRAQTLASLYVDDWKVGMSVGLHIFAPATYIFFASVLPAGVREQFRDETLGLFSIPHILCATAIAGVLQSAFGGQPLLIVGVAEPIVLVYYYIFKYCESTEEIGLALFRPFCAWVLILTALMRFALALLQRQPVHPRVHALLRGGVRDAHRASVLPGCGEGAETRVRRTARRLRRVQDRERRVVRFSRLGAGFTGDVPDGRPHVARRERGRCATSSPTTARPSRW